MVARTSNAQKKNVRVFSTGRPGGRRKSARYSSTDVSLTGVASTSLTPSNSSSSLQKATARRREPWRRRTNIRRSLSVIAHVYTEIVHRVFDEPPGSISNRTQHLAQMTELPAPAPPESPGAKKASRESCATPISPDSDNSSEKVDARTPGSPAERNFSESSRAGGRGSGRGALRLSPPTAARRERDAGQQNRTPNPIRIAIVMTLPNGGARRLVRRVRCPKTRHAVFASTRS